MSTTDEPFWPAQQVPNPGQMLDSTKMRYADTMFVPVFCTSEISSAVIDSLLESSRPPIEDAEKKDPKKNRTIRLCVLQSRDTREIVTPTIPPTQPFKSPFVGYSIEQVHATFIGSDISAEIDSSSSSSLPRPPPIRGILSGEAPNKPRKWSRKVFLILDQQTLDAADPTALVAYSPDRGDLVSHDVATSSLQTLRSDFRTSLRFALALETGQFDMSYAASCLPDGKGVVRQERWWKWLGDGGEGLKELGLDWDPYAT